MSDKRKLNVGPLPTQDRDYSVYEQTDVLWGRISLVFLLVVAVVFGFFYALFGKDSDAGRIVSVIEQRDIDQSQLAKNLAEEPLVVTAQLDHTKQADSVDDLPSAEVSSEQQVSADALKPEPKVASVEVVKSELSSTISNNQTQTVTMNSRADVSLISPVTTLHPGIREAVLSSSVDRDDKPVDTLGYEVFMNGEDLIKVILYTEMEALGGQNLKHQWVRGDKVYATVKIPVRSDAQQSFSSKFIDRYMMGEWTVNVLDQNDELYARANFIVKE